MNDVRAWLNSFPRNYIAGVQLYIKHVKDARLAAQFQAPETDTLRKELYAALKALIQPAPAVAPPAAEKADPPPVAPALEENEIAASLKRAADLKWKELMNVRAQLLAICTVEESPLDTNPDEIDKRAVLARRIVALQREVDAAYDDYRYALEHGVPREKEQPAAIAAPSIPVLELPQAITNLRKRLSKLRKEPEKYAAAITEKETLLNEYIRQLDAAKAGAAGSAE